MPRTIVPAAVAAAALLALGLAGCAGTSGSSSAGTSSAKGCPAAPSGSVSESVKVSGVSKEEPTVTVPKKLAVDSTQRTVVKGGSGDAVKDGAAITWSYALYNGTSGKKIGAIGYGSQQPQSFTVSDQAIPGLAKALRCTTVGSRLVAVIPPKEAFGSAGQSQLGIGKKDDLVVVADVRSIVKPLKPAAWTANVPAVDLTANPPTVTIPDTAPDDALRLKVLKKGDGATVKSGDTVTVDYQGTSWNTKKVFDQSFGKQPATFPTGGVIPGFSAAMVGQKVGSTVLVTIPPKDGYGTDSSSQSGLGGQTLVFLIEIEKTAAG